MVSRITFVYSSASPIQTYARLNWKTRNIKRIRINERRLFIISYANNGFSFIIFRYRGGWIHYRDGWRLFIISFLYLRDQKLIMFLVIFATLICFGIICFVYKYLPMGFLGIFHLFLSSIKQLLLLIHRKFENGITITLLKLASLFFSVLKWKLIP